jgi:hypothetical protein
MFNIIKIKNKQKQKGFIALTSVLILTIVLVTLMFASNTSSFFARFDSLGSEFKKISLGLSESCSNSALLKIAEDYNYKTTSDPDYDSAYGGVVVNVGLDKKCFINSIQTLSDEGVKKTLKIKTSAQYPSINGSWSTHEVKVVVQDPTFSPTNPPPTCSFTAYPASIMVGDEVTLQWNIGGNASSISIKRIIGTTEEELNPSLTDTPLKDSPTANATYRAKVSGPSGESECESPRSVVVGPGLSCSDTVLMLDRTSHMDPDGTENYLSDEKEAANNLLELYENLDSPPQASIGIFGAPGSSGPFNAEIRKELSSSFSTLKSAVTSGLSSAGGGTNLASAISEADDELNSSRHIKDRKKALILVSDGGVNNPTGNTTTDQQLATSAANQAKSAHGSDKIPTEIFTIHFGNNGGQTFLSSLATNSSNNHLSSRFTNLRPPTSCREEGYVGITSIGSCFESLDGHSGWKTPEGAEQEGISVATDTEGDNELFFNFGLDLSSLGTASPTGIGIQTQAWSSLPSNSSCKIGVSLSWDGGTTWTSGINNPTKIQSLGPPKDPDPVIVFGGSHDTWGRATWQTNDFKNENFRVRVHNIKESGCPSSSVTYLDYLQANIYYDNAQANAENTDGDHFFIAENSDDLIDLFESIGKMACPALAPPPPPPPAPLAPPAPPPPPPINIESWDEVINIVS